MTLNKLIKKSIILIFAIFLTALSACAQYSLSSEKSPDELKIHFIDVGQADSILVEQNDKYLLIDAGNNDDSVVIKSYLKSQGVTKLDYFIGTHVHEDHIGSADSILNSYKTDKIFFPNQTASTKTFENFVTAAKKSVGITIPQVSDTFKLGDAICTVLAPNGSYYDDPNDYSIVLKIQYGDNKFLLTGDAEAISEMEMVNKGLDLKSDVLKVGHHGSNSSSTVNFLNAVSPKYAVISVGAENQYGLPAQRILDRLNSFGIKTFRTDLNGTIVMTSNGKNISFNVE